MHYLPVMITVTMNYWLTFESVGGKIQRCHLSRESYWALPSYGTLRRGATFFKCNRYNFMYLYTIAFKAMKLMRSCTSTKSNINRIKGEIAEIILYNTPKLEI